MYAGVMIDSTNPPLAVNITSQLAYGLPFVLFDGITGANIPASVAGPVVLPQYVSGAGQIPQSVLGPAGLQPPVIVTAPTTASASVTVTANNNLATFDNTGASQAVTYNLPAPVVGMTYTFINSVGTTGAPVNITAASGVYIEASQFTNCSSTHSGHLTLTSNVMASITIQALNSGVWRATSCGGTWSAP
jgi:hypothetical protein